MDATAGTLTPPNALSESYGRSSSRAPSVRRQETEDSEKAGRELMHEVWLWEQRLDDEERSLLGPHQPTWMEEPEREEEQADAGAQSLKASIHHDEEAQEDTPPGVATRPGDPTVDHMQPSQPIVRFALSEDELLPAHYFDLMFGTSTGGLIATILGRLRMTIGETLALYRKVGDDLFGSRRSRVPLMTKYHHEPLERAVKEIVAKRCHEHQDCDGTDMHPFDSDQLDDMLRLPVPFDVEKPRVCQSCCLTATHDENISEAYLLRSYPHHYSADAPNWITRYNEGADMLPIYTVTRATTAAPFYFEMVKAVVDGMEKSFKDGGIRENNPSGAALSEFHALWEGTGVKQPAFMLSIGTGKPDQSQDGFASAWAGPLNRLPFVSKFLEKRAVIQNLLIKYTEGEKQHHNMRDHAHGEHTWYKRLNVSEGLETMPLDHWITGTYHGDPNVPGGASLTRMEEATTNYLEREFNQDVDSYAPPSTMLRQAAEKLVRQRRARERQGGLRWEVFEGRHLHRASTNGVAG
ncbi:hypothetical protein LTR37_018242 [Vermiconidia calcicola]|uniref:Uncharacterized protein n=1 Tax=Vermiconidia calcicola TaxID=1690605 RepID=A0ACC3MIT0_9PEZI|nr:hypothetical protein LTR37_018242 [Vermiconidia calcicola]